MKTLLLAVFVAAGFSCSVTVMAKPVLVQTSVSSRVAPEYERKLLSNGAPQKELYAISNGGMVPGTTLDSSIEKVSFSSIAGVVAEHLGRQNYFLAPDSKSARLLLVVQWGRTIPHNGPNYANAVNAVSAAMTSNRFAPITVPHRGDAAENLSNPGGGLIGADTVQWDMALMGLQMEERVRYRANEQNARLLGYIDDINAANGIARFAGAGDRYRELFEDIEEPRYYVLVKAYEFRAAVERRESKLLWITRISVATRGLDFDESLRPMIARAAPYFGRPTERLIRDFRAVVEMGETSVVEADASLSKPDKRSRRSP